MCCVLVFFGGVVGITNLKSHCLDVAFEVGLTSDGLDEAADELMALMCTGGSSSVSWGAKVDRYPP